VRRGANAAEIFSLAFSSTAQWLAVSSDKGTVHVFGLKVNSSVPENEKSQGSSSSDATIAPSSSSRSFIKFKGKISCFYSLFYQIEYLFLFAIGECVGVVDHVHVSCLSVTKRNSCQFNSLFFFC
jgi:hypothetical protein